MSDARQWRSDLPDVEVGGASLPEFLLGRADLPTEKPALVDGPSGRSLTYGQLAAGVERVAAGLAARGFGRGDVLGLYSPNLPEFPLAAYGAMAAGGAVTTASPLLTAGELAGQLAETGASALVTVPPFLDNARAAAEKADVGEVLVFGEADGATPFRELLAHDHPPATIAIQPERDVASLPFSSGTTGLPKGVELTHASMVTSVRQTQVMVRFDSDDVVLAVAPLFHVMGQIAVLACGLWAGATVVTLPRFELEGFLEAIQRHRVTTMIVAPPVMLALANHPLVDRYDLSSLRLIGCGSAPLSGDIEQRCADRLGCEVAQGLGMTEATCCIAIGLLGVPRRGSVGRLLPNTSARIVDPATGADLGPGRTGELWVRGPQLMRGYHDQPEATAGTVDADGWLHTGDLCIFDEDGYLYVVDRLKELIKYKGSQVAPAELEHLLMSHPAVADAAVVPRPDPEAGEVPVAYVVSRGQATADELRAWVAERVAPFKRLHAVEFTEQIPRSPIGKKLRRVLVEAERAKYALAAAPR